MGTSRRESESFFRTRHAPEFRCRLSTSSSSSSGTPVDPTLDAGPDAQATPTRCDPLRTFDEITEVTELNSPQDEYGIAVSPDGLHAVFSSKRVAAQTFDLYSADRNDLDAKFGAIAPIPALNTIKEERSPSWSADRATVFFRSSRNGPGANDLFFSTNTVGTYSEPQIVAFNGPANNVDPYVRADGKAFYFSRNANAVSSDIFEYASERGGTPIALPVINTDDMHEYKPVISDDGLALYFQRYPFMPSDGGAQQPGHIWLSTRSTATETFGPAALVPELNTDRSTFPSFLSADSCVLYFTKFVEPSYDIFRATRVKTLP